MCPTANIYLAVLRCLSPSRKHFRRIGNCLWKLLPVCCSHDEMRSKSTRPTSNNWIPSRKYVHHTGNRYGTLFMVCCCQYRRWSKLAEPVPAVRIHRETMSTTPSRCPTRLETLMYASVSFDNVRQWSAMIGYIRQWSATLKVKLFYK